MEVSDYQNQNFYLFYHQLIFQQIDNYSDEILEVGILDKLHKTSGL